MSWFDPDSITKNVSNLAQKASKLAQETLLDDPLLVELEDLKRERDALKLKLSESNGLKSIENDLEIEKLLNANAHLQKELNESHQKEQEASQMLSKIKTMAGEKIKRLTLQIQESERQPGSKNESSEAIIQDLQNQLEETLNSHQDQAKAFALEKQELKQIINTREMERDRFQQELIDYDSRQQEEAQRLKDALQEQRNLVQQLQSVAHDEESIRYNNLEKDRIAEELTLENDKLKAEVVACKSKLESLELKLKTKELENGGENDVENEEIVELKRQISQFQLNTSTEVQDWKQKYSELEKKYESSKLKIADHEKLVETTLQEHQNVVVQFEQKILELSSKPAVHNNTAVLEELTTPSDDQQEIISSLQDQVADLENVQVQLQNTLEQTKLKYKAALKDAEQAAELKQHITEYQARIVSLQQELAEATAHDQNELLSSVEYLTMELENARQEIAFLQSSSGEGNGVLLAEQQTQISVYQMEIQSLSEQLISAQAQNNEMESVLADLEASKSDLAEWKEKVEQLSIENQEKSLQYETQIIELSTMLEQAQYSTGNQSVGEDQIQNLNMQLDTLKLELQNANQEITYLQSISAAAGVSNQDGIIPLIVDSVQISQLQQQLQEYQTQCQSLENSCLEFQSVVENLSVENQALDQERTILSEKLDTFKQTVGVKIQQEMEESNRLKSLLEQSNHENENLMTQVQELSTHLANSQGNGDSQQEMEYLQKKTVELASQVQKSEAELNRLRSYLVEVEETSTNEVISMQSTIEEYQKQIAALEREREEWASVDQQEQELRESDKSLLLEAKQKLAEAVQERSSLQSKIDQDAITIKNLQNVLSQFENEKEQDIQDAVLVLKKALAKAESEAKEFKEKFTKATKRLSELEGNAKMVGPLEKELNEKTLQVGQLRHDIVQLQSHLNEAMRIMKQGSSEDSVDRKLVANLIVGFMVAKHGDKKRFEILSLMSSILQLSEDEKAKVGLIRQPGAHISPRSSQTAGPGENFMDMWVNFLSNETSNERRSSVSRSAELDANPVSLPSPQAPLPDVQPPAPAQKSWFG